MTAESPPGRRRKRRHPDDRASSPGAGTGAARALPAALLGFPLLAGILYGGVVHGPFVFDDLELQASARYHARTLAEAGQVLVAPGVPRKVGRATFALSHYLGGLDPFGYHLFNIALHALNGILLFLLAREILGRLPPDHGFRERAGPIALLGTLLWFVHPVQTQAVSYVWQRFTGLSALFFLAGLVAYLRARQAPSPRRWWWALAALAGGGLSVASKENAATFPLFVALLELALFQPRPFRPSRRTVLGLAVVALAFAGVAAVFLGPRFVEMIGRDAARRGFTPWERTMTEWRVVVHYLTLLAFPHPSRLRLDYDFSLSRSLLEPPTTLASLAALVSMLGLAAWLFGRRPLFALAILWFLGNLAIESSFIPLDLVYEHRLYLPSMLPFVALAAWGVTGARRTHGPWVLVVVAVFWSLWTRERNEVWADAGRLFEDNARKVTTSARVFDNLAQTYYRRGDFPAAQKAYERALALDPARLSAYNGLALVHLMHTGDAEEARRLLVEARRRRPADLTTRTNLGLALWALEDAPGAVREFEAALALSDPRMAASSRAGLYANLGKACLGAGDLRRAREALEQALALNPRDAEARADLEEVERRSRGSSSPPPK